MKRKQEKRKNNKAKPAAQHPGLSLSTRDERTQQAAAVGETLFRDIAPLIDAARRKVAVEVNREMILLHREIGQGEAPAEPRTGICLL